MNKLLKEYKPLVIFVILTVVFLIVGGYKEYKSQKEQEIIKQKTYENCIIEADKYMEVVSPYHN